jgi:hypothetical protein
MDCLMSSRSQAARKVLAVYSARVGVVYQPAEVGAFAAAYPHRLIQRVED